MMRSLRAVLALLREMVLWIGVRLARNDASGPGQDFRIASPDALSAARGNAVVFQKFAFVIGHAEHPEEVARRALRSGLAVAAVDSIGDLLVSERVARAMAQLELIEEFTETAKTGLGALARFAVCHPRFTWNLVRIYRSSPRRYSSETDTDASGTGDAIVETIDRFVRASILESLAAHVDATHLRPGYVQSEPWTRLSLPTLFCEDSTGAEVEFELSALVHRSGVGVFTLARFLDGADPSALNTASSCAPKFLASWTVDERMLQLAAAATGTHIDYEAVERIEGDGRTVIRVPTPELTSSADVFHMCRDALVYGITGLPLSPAHYEYVMVPLISARGIPDRYHSEIGPLLALHYQTEVLDEIGDMYPMDDVAAFTASPNATVYMTEACMVHFFRERFRSAMLESYKDLGEVPGQEWGMYEYAVGTVLDLSLCRMQMIESDERSLRSAASTSALRLSTREMLLHYSEISGERLFSAGELAKLEAAFLNRHQFGRRRDGLLRQQQLASSVLDSRESELAIAANLRLQRMVVVLTVLVGLVTPIGALFAWDQADEELPKIADASFSTWGAWTLVAVPLIALLALAGYLVFRLASAAAARLHRPEPLVSLKSPAKFASRLGDVRIEFSSESEDVSMIVVDADSPDANPTGH